MKARHLGLVAFAVSLALATFLFGVWPEVDLVMARWFLVDGQFPGDHWTWSRLSYRWYPSFGWIVVAWSTVVVICRVCFSRPRMAVVRRGGMLLLVAVFGLGVVVHGVLKEGSGRPRPSQVTAFSGSLPFQPALHVSHSCPHNCSFVSGHAAGGFALLALGALGARRTRLRWWLTGTAIGTVVGLGRMAQGSHFASDIVFALLVIWGVTLAVRFLWLRVAAYRRQRRRAAAGAGSAPAAVARTPS